MRSKSLIPFVLAVIVYGSAFGAGNAGEEAAEFPPGVFTDGQQYRLADLRASGKVVVLYMYEKDCPSCRTKTTTEFNPIVESLKDKPVKFIAIGAGDNAADVRKYVSQTQIKMPVYVDAYSLMEKRYGQTISLNNIYQWRVIGIDGKISGYRPNGEWLDRALAVASWKYKDKGYHASLSAAVEALEWGRYEVGVKALKPALKSPKKEIAESAGKLYEEVKTEAQAWRTEADTAMETDPIAAYDGYTRLKGVFDGDKEFLTGVDAALTKLKADKIVVAELAARKMFTILAAQTAKPTPPPAAQMAASYRTIAKKYPETPTGKMAEALAAEFGG